MTESEASGTLKSRNGSTGPAAKQTLLTQTFLGGGGGFLKKPFFWSSRLSFKVFFVSTSDKTTKKWWHFSHLTNLEEAKTWKGEHYFWKTIYIPVVHFLLTYFPRTFLAPPPSIKTKYCQCRVELCCLGSTAEFAYVWHFAAICVCHLQELSLWWSVYAAVG